MVAHLEWAPLLGSGGRLGAPQNFFLRFPPSYGVVTYGARAHPELSTAPNTLVVSYDVNFAATHGLENPDSSVYRPRFIDVTVG